MTLKIFCDIFLNEVNKMSFTYKPLWKLLIDKDMSKKELMKSVGISKSTLDKMSRGENISLK